MTEKEKQAIERLKQIDETTEEYDGNLFKKDFEKVLNLIEKKDEYIDKLENKLMYALSPTTHELAITTQEQFKTIIRDNLEEDTYTIKRALKEYWEDKKYEYKNKI